MASESRLELGGVEEGKSVLQSQVEEVQKKISKVGSPDEVLETLRAKAVESDKRVTKALQLCEKVVKEFFSVAIRKVLYNNPSVDFTLHGINFYHEFYGGKLFVVVGDECRDPNDVPYQLVDLPEP
ncbi:hypothetical protein RJT34_13816 [Clitoria ternatea]|uniref:Uncharacterized protein n=1 Tax=Clitoria ternatea TaxID=43366 RepID=A0AAN9JSQ6_CLITE